MAGSEFCTVHKSDISAGQALAVGTGALVGNALIPGVGGIVVGGIVGALARALFSEEQMAKTKVFVSFDFDNDRVLKDFIIGQAKLADSPFDIIDHSLKEASPERDWEKKAHAAINRAEIVLVIVGHQTYKAHGVLKEIAMAREAGVKIVQIIGYKEGDYTPVPNAGRLYAWNWNNLKKLLG
ncbi:MAG: TIR domain-containing protein [Burkholderiaceae bacterium]